MLLDILAKCSRLLNLSRGWSIAVKEVCRSPFFPLFALCPAYIIGKIYL